MGLTGAGRWASTGRLLLVGVGLGWPAPVLQWWHHARVDAAAELCS